jgi:dipeptidyl aminopeptidase/acylaminoacyl peptidase
MSPDGEVIAYTSVKPTLGDSDLMALSRTGGGNPSALVQTDKLEGKLQFSPDGRWIIYSSSDGNAVEVFAQAYPAAGGRYQVSVGGGSSARWRADGKEIFYLSADATLMAVDVSTSPSGFRAGPPRALFKVPIETRSPMSIFRYAVAADGQKFLVARPLGAEAPAPTTVMLNWAAGRSSALAR